MRTGRVGKLSCANPAPDTARSASHAPMITPMRPVFMVCVPCPDRFLRRSKASGFAGRMPTIPRVGKSGGAE